MFFRNFKLILYTNVAQRYKWVVFEKNFKGFIESTKQNT
jgi:hypothetical protein